MLLGRLRTSRGFGVHSPLAFELITTVLCSRKARYYATRALPDAASRRLMRVAVYLRPQTYRVVGEAAVGVVAAMEAAGVSRDDGSNELVIVGNAQLALPSLPERGAMLLTDAPCEAVERLLEGRESGVMTFSGRREHLIVARPDLPRQHFNIMLR